MGAPTLARDDYRALCGTVSTPAIERAFDRYRVLEILDGWVQVDPAKRSHTTTGHPGGKFACCLTDLQGRADPNQKKRFVASSADDARSVAAIAIHKGEV